MIITCPDCTTRYTVDPGAFASGGRKVRCFNCGHLWSPGGYAAEERMDDELPPAYRQEAAPPPRSRAMAPAPKPKPVVKPAPKPVPPPKPVAAPKPVPKPAPAPQPVAAPPPPPVQDEPIPMAAVMAAAAAAAVAPPPPPPMPPAPPPAAAPAAPPRVSDQPSQQLSDEELDKMLGGQDDPAPIPPILKEEPIDDNDVDPEKLPDPDPIPDSLILEDDEEDDDDEGPGIGRLLGLVGGVLLAACLAAAVFLQDMIVGMVPGMASVYQMVGLGEPLGAGLEIRQVRSSRTVENDIDTLTVDGVIVNVSANQSRLVPNVRVALYDAANVEVMFRVAAPEKGELTGDDRTRFKTQLKSPPPTARRLEVTFTKEDSPDPPMSSAGSGMTAPQSDAAPAEPPPAGSQ